MMAISVIGLLVLLMLVSGAVGVVFLIATAIQQRRLGLVALAGGLGALAFFLVIAAFTLFAYRQTESTATRVATNEWTTQDIQRASRQAVNTAQQFHVSVGTQSPPPITYSSPPTWLAFSKIAFVIGLTCALVFIVFRRLTTPRAACERRRLWPALLAVPLIGLLFIGSVRVASQPSVKVYDGGTEPMVQMVPPGSPAQPAALANGFAKMEAEMHQNIEHGNINELMDKSDRPRIPLPPVAIIPSAVPPNVAAPQMPAQPAAAVTQIAANEAPAPASPDAAKEKTSSESEKPSAKSTDSNTKKSSAGSKSKRKNTTKAPAKTSDKSAEQVAETKSDAGAKDAKAASSAPSAAEPPAEHFDASPKIRPAWVGETYYRRGNVLKEVIETDEYATDGECLAASDILTLLKIYQHMQQLAGHPPIDTSLPSIEFRNGAIFADGALISAGRGSSYWYDARFRALSDMGIGTDYAQKLVATDSNDKRREFLATIERPLPVGEMKKLWRQIEFTSAIDNQLRETWNNYQRKQRFYMFGAGAGSVVTLLGVVFGLLKLDTWTKGYYTKRLFIGAPLVILGMVCLCFMLIG